MEIGPEFLITALILPIYPVLFMINRKIGKYDQVCRHVEEMEKEIKELWTRVNEV